LESLNASTELIAEGLTDKEIAGGLVEGVSYLSENYAQKPTMPSTHLPKHSECWRPVVCCDGYLLICIAIGGSRGIPGPTVNNFDNR
jgi:hypothetical protein